MKKIKNILKLTSITTAILLPNLVQAQATSPMEVSATVEAGCFIEADNINFGNLITPITNQSATSNMRILCSKNASLSISINYSASGAIISNSNYEARLAGGPSNNYNRGYKVYVDGNPLTNTGTYDIHCEYSDGVRKFQFDDQKLNQLYGTNYELFKRIPDTIGICNSATNMQGTLNFAKFNQVTSNISVGVLTGVVSNEKINYFIEQPSSTNVWGSSSNYPITGTGATQTIPMNAKINVSGNPTYRMTPDTYQDTLTVVLTY